MTKALIVGPCRQGRAVSVSRLARPIIVCVTTLIAVFGICAWAGLRLNSTGSLPLGIYILSTAADAYLVEFCPQSLIRKSLLSGDTGILESALTAMIHC